MDWTPLISGFVGVLVGSASSVVIAHIQSRSILKRDRARLALRAALADFHADAELAKQNQVDNEGAPLSAYIHYHARLMELVAKNHINRESLETLDAEQEEIMKMAREKFYRLNPHLKREK